MKYNVRRIGRTGLVATAVTIAGCASLPVGPLSNDGPNWERAQPDFDSIVVTFVDSHCASCHGDRRQRAGIDLESLTHASSIESHEETWERVAEMVRGNQMPPSDRRQPEPDEAEELLAWIDGALTEVSEARKPDPGRVTARRLNRSEYNNTVRDLLGVNLDATADFPPDDSGYGFDTIGDVLSTSPLLMEKYFDAAETVAAAAMAREREAAPEARHIFTCDHETGEHDMGCLEDLAGHLLPRAFRRTATREEVSRIVALGEEIVAEGDSIDEAAEFMVQATLLSPQFIFRTEHLDDPTDADSIDKVSSFDLASRLSYFLWSSMPDDALLADARRHQLGRPKVLRGHVERMLRDPKARAFAENFAGQWLEVRNLLRVDPDPDIFPTFDDGLRAAMAEETYSFFEAVMNEDMSILTFIDADFTFANDQLAQHYGYGGVEGDGFVRVALAEDTRGGILTQASVLTVSSYPTRTSPVIRGRWILENILGTPPPEPPPNVPPLDEAAVGVSGTLRQQLEAHRDKPGCASCHTTMDPLGFSLENFDAIGRWRTEDSGGFPIDAAGELPTGEALDGAASLKSVLLSKKELFTRCLTEKMLTYALGRGLERYDDRVVDEICEELAENNYRFSVLVSGIVESFPFQKLRGEEIAEDKKPLEDAEPEEEKPEAPTEEQ